MQYNSLEEFLTKGSAALAKGPVCMIFVEDLVEVESTILHHIKRGFKEVLVLAPDELRLPGDVAAAIHRIRFDVSVDGALTGAINRVIDAAPDIWLFYCFNAEYLFYPFCETRTVGEMLTFNTEERRRHVLTYVIDLYADDLNQNPHAVSLEGAHLDRSGYYAAARKMVDGEIAERQLDFFGGLRWRFEEHIPKARRKIDRISLFRGEKGLRLRDDHTFSDEEYNTYACPWHNNITAALCSFRTAKALKTNPGSTFDIETFRWHNSTPFQWNSQQLLDFGLIEPGQWF